MKRKRFLLLVLLFLIILFIPIKYTYKDGGTIKYCAVLWSYTDYHQITEQYDENGKEVFYEPQVFEFFPNNWVD